MVEVTKGEFGALFAYALDTRKLTVALGHGLAAVAKTVGANQADIDAIEAELAEQDEKLLVLHKFLEDNDG